MISMVHCLRLAGLGTGDWDDVAADVERRLATARMAGRIDEAGEAWRQIYELDSTTGSNLTPLLARIEIEENEPDAADRCQQLRWDQVPHDGAAQTDQIALTAAIRGLLSDRAGAARDFREAIRHYRDLRLDIDQAIMQLVDPATVAQGSMFGAPWQWAVGIPPRHRSGH